MATAIVTAPVTAKRSQHRHEHRAYWSASMAMATAASRNDQEGVRRLLMRREHLLATLKTAGRRPSRALTSEVQALDAQTMLALGVEPPRAASPVVRPWNGRSGR